MAWTPHYVYVLQQLHFSVNNLVILLCDQHGLLFISSYVAVFSFSKHMIHTHS